LLCNIDDSIDDTWTLSHFQFILTHRSKMEPPPELIPNTMFIFAARANITIDDLKYLMQKMPEHVSTIIYHASHNENLLPDDLLLLDDCSGSDLSNNVNITIKFIRENIDNITFHWESLSVNMGIPIDEILKNKDLSWVHSLLSERSDLRIVHVLSNPDILWNFYQLSSNRDAITHDDIIANPKISWNSTALSCGVSYLN
jgi:hypothetical protein